MPAQSSRSIGFLMLLGSSLTLCGIICNNNAMLSPSLLRYDPSKSNFRLLVTILHSTVCLVCVSSNESFKVSTIPKLLMWHRRGSLGNASGHPNHSRSRTWTNSNVLFSFTHTHSASTGQGPARGCGWILVRGWTKDALNLAKSGCKVAVNSR